MKILVVGANSDIAFEVCKLWSQEGHELLLASRNSEQLKERCKSFGVSAMTFLEFNALNQESLDKLLIDCPKPDLLFIAYGFLGEEKLSDLQDLYQINFYSQAYLAERYAQNETKNIAVIGSVAGLRGRASNYHYGSSKAGMHSFLSGLRNRYFKTGLKVITIIPGPVDTKMTRGKILKTSSLASVEKVAKQIHQKVSKGQEIIYCPWYWKWIMIVIRLIPEFIFKRMNL